MWEELSGHDRVEGLGFTGLWLARNHEIENKMEILQWVI